MRSRADAGLRAVMFAAALCWAAPAVSQQPESQAPAPATQRISESDIAAAIAKVKADPNLTAERRTRMLKWVEGEKDARKNPGWVKWLRELFSWIAQNGRFLFWGVLALLASFLLIYVWRLIRAYGLPERSPGFVAPSFVRDLDIRPESLPADIGSAARKLWDEGAHRSALALLYRGLLSRLVHAHGVPIRDSSTEGDCLSLASRHLAAEEQKSYVTSLVRVWQRAVYGGESIAAESVHALCDEFSRALDEPGGAESAAGRPAAGLAT